MAVATLEPALATGATKPARYRLIWPYLLAIAGFHLLLPLLLLPGYFSWWGVLFLPVGNYVFCSMGIGAGYHRLLTHRSFECPLWLEHVLAYLGLCCLQDAPARWVMIHRVHHQHSDNEQDPHSPTPSWFWGHVGWVFVENTTLSSVETYERYVPDMLGDRFYRRLERRHAWVWWYLAHIVAIVALGAFVGRFVPSVGAARMAGMFFLWGVVARTVYTWHVTWGVNSFSHLWGYQTHATRDNSRNNWLFALLTNGDGWHNNHHAQPRAADHGRRWWELDVTYLTICLLEKLGLTWNVQRAIQ